MVDLNAMADLMDDPSLRKRTRAAVAIAAAAMVKSADQKTVQTGKQIIQCQGAAIERVVQLLAADPDLAAGAAKVADDALASKVAAIASGFVEGGLV